MLTIKNRVRDSGFIWLIFLGMLAGCTPPGPRALLQGKRLIEHGDYARAAEKLRTATSLIGTNAQAWNYLGIACQHLGERDQALRAYQHALSLNHDLSEAHYNLGCLWLEENKLDLARTEFTTFTLRRGNSAEGFLKLAAVQARARDLAAAEKSFNDVLRLSPNNPEALNGLGLIRLQQRRPAEAQQYFAAALKQEPAYRPALLNSAIVAHTWLHDLPIALARYREYLSLRPSPPDAETVAGIVRDLERQLAPQRAPAAMAKATQPVLTNAIPPKQATSAVTRILASPKAETRPAGTLAGSPTQPVEVVAVSPEPPLKSAQQPGSRPAATQPAAAEPMVTAAPRPSGATTSEPAKRGFFDRVNPANVFRSEPKPGQRVTPLPAPKDASGPAQPEASTYASSVPSGPFSHYNYRSPAAPAAGNRHEAQRYFEQGLQAQRAHRLSDAIQAFSEATRQDPSLFEAQFYLAFTAAEAGDLATALTRYEYALAIAPNDANARYNFALALKQANCVPDAAHELERLLTVHPNEARAHLALANIYAEQFHDPAQARPHYLRAVELDPRSSQASEIRNWLRDHPG